MYSIVLMAAFSGAPLEADYLLPRRAARIEARQMRRASASCEGGSGAGAAAYSSGCSGGQAIQFQAASCQGGQGGQFSSGCQGGQGQSAPTTFYYVPASAPQAQGLFPLFPNRPFLLDNRPFLFNGRQCAPGQVCY